MKYFAIFKNMHGPWSHCAKWYKWEKDKYYTISLICGILKKKKKEKKEAHR